MEIPDYFDRFWAKVDIPFDDGCWEWTASKDKYGYGRMNTKGRNKKAHRLSYEYFYGVVVPEDVVIMHKCDNRPCVRPDHLERGTTGDNNRDAMVKGRHMAGIPSAMCAHPGILNGSTKLTEEMVLDIRNKHTLGQATQKELAAFYGLNEGHVSRVIHRYRWKHV
jgi:hypothetical protein